MKKSELKKVKKRSKGRLSIHEINTIQTAYFKKFTALDYIQITIAPALTFAFMTYFLAHYIPATIVAAVVGILFGLFKQLPLQVKKNYYYRSYVERNRFLNNFTQLIINENLPLLDVLEKIIPRLSGELYNDLTILLARITTADSKMASEAFKDLANKYEDDVVFAQYIEQIETVFIEGHRNIETFKELKKQHNLFLEKLQGFQKDKEEYNGTFVSIALLVVIVLAVSIFGLGIPKYLEAFAHTTVGAVCIGLYLLILYVLYSKSIDYIYDDSISKI